MDPFSVVAVALAKVGADCFSASFAAGIAGNLIASAGYDHLVKNPVDSALRSLRDLVKSGVTSENHDLLRALWIAQNEALVLCCEEILRCEKRLDIVPGATHLFPESGALERVASLAVEWFKRHLPGLQPIDVT